MIMMIRLKVLANNTAWKEHTDSDEEYLKTEEDEKKKESYQDSYDSGFLDASESVADLAGQLFLQGVEVDGRFFRNLTNGKLHRGKLGCLAHTACGSLLTANIVPVEQGEAFDDSKPVVYCDTCFSTKKPERSKLLKRTFSDTMDPHWDTWA